MRERPGREARELPTLDFEGLVSSLNDRLDKPVVGVTEDGQRIDPAEVTDATDE